MSIEPAVDWDALWRERPALVRIARRRTSSLDDAEDLASEALLRAAERGPTDPGPYLTRVTVHLCADAATERGYHRQRGRYAVAHHTAEPSPEEAVCMRAHAATIAALIAQLPRRQQDVVRLRAAELSLHQIAVRLGLSYKCVESLLARARASVRAHLAAGPDQSG